jgi:activator of HSP90 ATPase
MRMTKTITQNVVFKNTKASTLYSMFLDSKQHTAITGGVPAKISAKEGAEFSAHGGYIIGKNLQLVKDKLIVQSWHGTDWDKGSLDSTFILLFEQKGKDAVIHMTHANIPDKHADGIKQGWVDYYWIPWKEHLASSK